MSERHWLPEPGADECGECGAMYYQNGGWRGVECKRQAPQPSLTPADLIALRDEWRAKAQECWTWARECADWDGANRHELRNRAGVYENCADQLDALITNLSSETEKK